MTLTIASAPRNLASRLADIERFLSTADVLDDAETARRDLAWEVGSGFEAATEIGAERAGLVLEALELVRCLLADELAIEAPAEAEVAE